MSKLTDFYPVNGVDTNKVLNQQVFTSSGTWTRPAGVTRVFVSMSGGGGGGSVAGVGAGGNGGDTSFGTIIATGGAYGPFVAASSAGGLGSSGGVGPQAGSGGCGQLVETWVPVSANVSVTIGSGGSVSRGDASVGKPGYCIVSWWV